jgi:hypothetical protein
VTTAIRGGGFRNESTTMLTRARALQWSSDDYHRRMRKDPVRGRMGLEAQRPGGHWSDAAPLAVQAIYKDDE